jgi:hypothetical protein
MPVRKQIKVKFINRGHDIAAVLNTDDLAELGVWDVDSQTGTFRITSDGIAPAIVEKDDPQGVSSGLLYSLTAWINLMQLYQPPFRGRRVGYNRFNQDDED